MNELRLTFEHDETGSYRAQFNDGGSTKLGVPVTLAPFLNDDDFENLRWYLED
jgi:hypothetical protein